MNRDDVLDNLNAVINDCEIYKDCMETGDHHGFDAMIELLEQVKQFIIERT